MEHCAALPNVAQFIVMEAQFSVTRCRQILGDAAKEYDDKGIEEIRDTFIAFSDFVIDSEIDRLKLKQNAHAYEKQQISA